MEELEALLEVIGVGVLDDDISVMQRGLEEELVGHGEGEVSAIEAEEDGGDKGVAEEGGLGGMGVEGGDAEGCGAYDLGLMIEGFGVWGLGFRGFWV